MHRFLFTIIGCVSLTTVIAQYVNVQINPSSTRPVEPSVDINPLNPAEIAVGAVLDDYYYSKDGGNSWNYSKLECPYGVWGDPVLKFDAKGRLYYFHLSDYEQGSWIDRIVCQYSDKITDASNFTQGSFPKPNGTKAQDKHWVDIDPKTGTIYMTWTQFDQYDSKLKEDSSRIMFSKSIDRGATWSNPKQISFYNGDCLDKDLTVEGAVPVVNSDGSLVVTWTGPKGMVVQRSSDAGNTWLPVEQIIAPHPEGWDYRIPGIMRCNGLPVLQIDRSGGVNNGALYLTWSDQRNGTSDTDVWCSVSKDKGFTWSNPIRVNQDSTKTHQFMATMTVDQSNGHLHWLFYDRSRSKNPNETEVVWVRSKDGGATFDQQWISERPFVPNVKVFFGDYIAIAAYNNKVAPVWVRMDMGKPSLWTALIPEK
jgi:hypothetical protein